LFLFERFFLIINSIAIDAGSSPSVSQIELIVAYYSELFLPFPALRLLFKMPGEVIDQPNPPPLPSDLPEELDKFAVQLQNISLDQKDYDDLAKFRRAACYIAAGVYLYHFAQCERCS
jgi:hypothetical protein